MPNCQVRRPEPHPPLPSWLTGRMRVSLHTSFSAAFETPNPWNLEPPNFLPRDGSPPNNDNQSHPVRPVPKDRPERMSTSCPARGGVPIPSSWDGLNGQSWRRSQPLGRFLSQPHPTPLDSQVLWRAACRLVRTVLWSMDDHRLDWTLAMFPFPVFDRTSGGLSSLLPRSTPLPTRDARPDRLGQVVFFVPILCLHHAHSPLAV